MSDVDCASPPTSVPSTPPSSTVPTSLLPPLGIATLSLGSCDAGHSIASKLEAAVRSGFTSVELFDNDWYSYRDSFAKEHGYPLPACEGDEASKAAARELGDLARRIGVEFSCFQPLRDFEGLVDEQARLDARRHAKGVLDVLALLGIDLVLVCSSTVPTPRTTGSLARAVEDLAWIADLAATYPQPIRIMYEALSFAAHRRRWQDVWQVVETANRPNLGICLDSFNTLAYEWADPYDESGRLSDDVDDKLEDNMQELVRRVPGDKIFLYQVADARFMSPPMTPPSDPSIPRIRPWSRSHRLFPLEASLGAYLPVDRFSDAVVRTGYKGPWSLEVFNDSLADERDEVPFEHAKRGIEGLRRAAIEAYARAAKA
ncbi:hypothetical protein JCM10212_000152 [Sporobolomyces blumeae]